MITTLCDSLSAIGLWVQDGLREATLLGSRFNAVAATLVRRVPQAVTSCPMKAVTTKATFCSCILERLTDVAKVPMSHVGECRNTESLVTEFIDKSHSIVHRIVLERVR